GRRPFAYFWVFPKVSRRKGGTLSRRYRSNGYAHHSTCDNFRRPKVPSPIKSASHSGSPEQNFDDSPAVDVAPFILMQSVLIAGLETGLTRRRINFQANGFFLLGKGPHPSGTLEPWRMPP
ncbi:hypothetical protein, partial [Pseudomonas fluorescens]|uniref:hypothetical protein n=1 Tax=Pseudomonas fluorescens TaxID=294 RepID=UPI001A91D9FD